VNKNEAIEKVNGMTFMPGWKLRASGDYYSWNPQPGVVYVDVLFHAPDTSDPVGTTRTWPLSRRLDIKVDDIDSDIALYGRVLAGLFKVWQHEAMESLKVDGKAPFHPHRMTPQAEWPHLTRRGWATKANFERYVKDIPEGAVHLYGVGDASYA
jgi:hypothetical protein